MRWSTFIFWFYYRLVLATLAHFNWAISLYTNCMYFTLWKSYDLVWFWMHLLLCACFPSLRKHNYLIVWCNLVRKRCARHPDLTYKQIYIMYYRRQLTRSQRELSRLEIEERAERDHGDTTSQTSDDNAERVPERANGNGRGNVVMISPSLENDCEEGDGGGSPISQPQPLLPQADVRSDSSSRPSSTVIFSDGKSVADATSLAPGDALPQRPARRSDRPLVAVVEPMLSESSSGESDTTNSTRWIDRIPLPKMLAKRLRHEDAVRDTASNLDLPRTPEPSLRGADNTSAVGDTDSRWSDRLMPRAIVSRFKANHDHGPEDGIEKLFPDFTNRFDVPAKVREKLEKRDRKALRNRIRKRRKAELKARAREEAKKKARADAIELLLQLLRMVTYFALLTGNIRKTFVPAHFNYLRPGTHSYDNPELIMIMRTTVFLDVLLFWFNALYAFCLQCQLCCRLGLLKFWMWTLLLGFVATFTMLVPMSYVQDQLDTSWCRFLPNTTLARFQPNW